MRNEGQGKQMSKKVLFGEAFRVNERLPPLNTHVLVTCAFIDGSGEEFVDTSYRMDNGEWEITAPGNETVRPFKVVAWVPYPAPFGFLPD